MSIRTNLVTIDVVIVVSLLVAPQLCGLPNQIHFVSCEFLRCSTREGDRSRDQVAISLPGVSNQELIFSVEDHSQSGSKTLSRNQSVAPLCSWTFFFHDDSWHPSPVRFHRMQSNFPKTVVELIWSLWCFSFFQFVDVSVYIYPVQRSETRESESN